MARMEWRGTSAGRRLGAVVAGLLMTGAGQFVLGNARRGWTYVGLSLASSLVMAAAAFVSPTLMATVMLWSFALFLFSLFDVAIARPAAIYPPGRALAAILIGVFLVTRIHPFVIRAFVIEAFRIPSGSMNPTLLSGDHVFLDKIDRAPDRGDVIVYELPTDRSKEYVKRVIGLPGDVIETRGDTLSVNGEEQPHVFVEDTKVHQADCQLIPARISEETLGGARTYRILDLPHHESEVLDGRWTVPEGELFVMGDNRDNSMDSRSGHTVPLDHVRGVGLFVYFSWDNCGMRLRTERFGRRID